MPAAPRRLAKESARASGRRGECRGTAGLEAHPGAEAPHPIRSIPVHAHQDRPACKRSGLGSGRERNPDTGLWRR